LVSLSTQLKLVGVETAGVGTLLLLTSLLSLFGFSNLNPSISSDFPVIGAVLLFVSHEAVTLARRLPREATETGKREEARLTK
jgi:hypothetical protein